MPELDAQLAALRDAGAARGLPAMVTLTPEETRERVRAGNRLCADGPDLALVQDIIVTHDGHPVGVRVYGSLPRPGAVTLIYAHGGGWVTGDLDYADEFCRYVAREAGCSVVSVDYRLAPEHPYPAALDDVHAVTSWALGQTRGDFVALGGDSAGGNLAAACALRLRDEAASSLAFQLLIYPVVDHDLASPSYLTNATAFPIGMADMRWFFDHYTEPGRRGHPYVVPLRAEDLSGLPRTHVVTVGHDPLHHEGAAYAQLLSKHGVEVTHADLPTMCHGFLRFTAASAGATRARDDLVETVAALVEKTTATSTR